MRIEQWTWARGVTFKVPADEVGPELTDLAEKLGKEVLDPEDLVRAARRNRRGTLRKLFTWDDGKAAERWRLEEARQVLRSIQVRVVVAKDSPPTVVRAFVSLEADRAGENGSFRQTVRVLSDPEKRGVLVRQALGELATWQRRYSHLAELADLFSAIERELSQPIPLEPVGAGR